VIKDTNPRQARYCDAASISRYRNRFVGVTQRERERERGHLFPSRATGRKGRVGRKSSRGSKIPGTRGYAVSSLSCLQSKLLYRIGWELMKLSSATCLSGPFASVITVRRVPPAGAGEKRKKARCVSGSRTEVEREERGRGEEATTPAVPVETRVT